MNLRKLFFRDEQEMGVDVFEAWEVRWHGRVGVFSGDTRPHIKVFPKKEDAEAFKKALEDAFVLLKITGSHTYVTLCKQG